MTGAEKIQREANSRNFYHILEIILKDRERLIEALENKLAQMICVCSLEHLVGRNTPCETCRLKETITQSAQTTKEILG